MLKSLLDSKNGRIVAGNYTALLFIQGANVILPLIALPYLVRTLEAERFGLVMIAQTMGVFLTILVDFGFNISATREVSLLRSDRDKLSQLYWNVFFVKFCLVVVSFLIVLILITFVERFRVEPLVYVLSFGMVLGHAIFPTWFFQGIERMRVITFVNVLAKVLFTVAIFFFVLSPEDYEWVPLLNGGGFILAGIIGLAISFKYVHFKSPDFSQVKILVSETASLFVSNFATSLYTSGNTFILGMIAGDALAGVYSSMEKLVLAIKNIYVPLYQAIFPWLATKEETKITMFVKKMMLPVGISGGLISGILILIAKPLLHFIYNDAQIDSYTLVFQILAGIAFFSALNMLLVSLFFPAIKHYKKRMYALVIGGLFNLLVAIVGARYFSIYGVAVSAIVTEFFILCIAGYFFSKPKIEIAGT
ncbi:hypothetical protein EAX61_10015 [Dokdonia sinensis]|uniref:Uncharacterized protein n=1 Tax=Dokdonia sinensis TaxID=2479847 RepID=A0A3M0G8I0_9FLAO|nr:oligosaccharide flippase family protein [Dokdonia sinensis]RMB57953.1 hypothetical protein EAX61_10015 [Dokdonia sinensis]